MSLVASASYSCCGGWRSPCWRVRCRDCGAWVTKHDFTEGEAMAAAQSHDCPRRSGV